MYSELMNETSSRQYRMRKRQEDIAETRRRIVDAAVALHAQTHDFYKGAATILSTHSG